MTHDEMIEVIQAHKNGKEIEHKFIHGDISDFRVTNIPSFNFEQIDYRIKIEKPILKKNHYVGKQVIFKDTNTVQIISSFSYVAKWYILSGGLQYTENDLKKSCYIEGIDF